jgi:CTP:molybdopterin cytidylyltransferase MocA
MAHIAAVVLAAGEASRFGSPKQRLLLPRVLERLRETSLSEIVVVEGAHPVRLDEPSNEVLQGIRVVGCPGWERGPGASLRCGLASLPEDVEAAVVIMADGPFLSPGAVERVVAEWRATGGTVAASYDGDRGHPLVVGREGWEDVPDEGLRARPARLVPCDDLGAPGDVDRPEDLRQERGRD